MNEAKRSAMDVRLDPDLDSDRIVELPGDRAWPLESCPSYCALSYVRGCSSRLGERYGTMIADLLSLVLAGHPDEGAPAPTESPDRGTTAETLGAVVHELNQPLTSILGYTELLSRKIDINATGGRYVEQLMCEVDRLVVHVERLTHLAQYRVMPYPGPTEILDIEASPPPSED